MSSTQVETKTEGAPEKPNAWNSRRNKKNEFQDGRVLPVYTWKESARDWYKQGLQKNYTDEQVEYNLLLSLPFYPESDGKRKAEIINTDIGGGNYIHEFYIENTEKPSTQTVENKDQVTDVVLIHGYAASLGLFIDNFDLLSSAPGIKIHAIDLLGFGFSSRPKFPNFPSKTKSDIFKIEDWFIDAVEEWRKKRNINRFILMGHSFGGYLSCAYVLKYNKSLIDAAGKLQPGMVDKLVLISPVGLERNKFSLLKDEKSEGISDERRKLENQNAPSIALEDEVNADQESIIHNEDLESADEKASRGRRLLDALWRRNYSPFSIIRNMGPLKSKMISRWTTHRFAHTYFANPMQFQAMHDYIYRVFNAKGSGEFAITRVLATGALPKLPLLDRCPEKFVKMNTPTFWIYGDKDWMNDEAGLEMTNEINKLSSIAMGKNLAQFSILPNSGHHLYLDNPKDFNKEIFKFIGFKSS